MARKKVDSRVRTLIENGIKTNHRSFFVVVGDRGKEQVVNLYSIMAKSQVKARPPVVWCYKKDLGFSTHRQKRMKQLKKKMQRGQYDPNEDNPFELFVTSTQIRWLYYKDSHKVLGQTFGMCVIQDFESLTPNLLCRVVETVEGGGIVVLLLRTMNSLKQLYSMTMDVHSKLATESHKDVVPRFNERFMLSLSQCSDTLFLDDELNVLKVSKVCSKIKPLPRTTDDEDEENLSPAQKQLKDLKVSLEDTQPIGSLVATCKTLDQAKAVMTFTDAIAEKTLKSTVALTASRGRGKSAALGLSIASAINYGYANIFVTSPTPENLQTLFEFIFKGLKQLGYEEHLDYEAIQSTNPDFKDCIVRINIFKAHRQTVQYVLPQHNERMSQAELLVIDEAAAIPLPVVKKLLGNYLVFMASTVNGYEGTGRSLSLKLVQQLRQRQNNSGAGGLGWKKERRHKGNAKQASRGDNAAVATGASARVLREVNMEEPIRYSNGDNIESWLHELLCLDVTKIQYRITGCPHPTKCDLFAVNRDSLFSYHKLSETFLQRMMSLYVSSHYKNTPNDLQIMSDAPAHRLFVLLSPPKEDGSLPDVLCVVQVSLEGQISQTSVKKQMERAFKAAGDLIPWTMSQQYLDNDFAQLSGARIVRIATHPDAVGMGYGTRAIELLKQYYEGSLCEIDADELPEEEDYSSAEGDYGSFEEGLKIRAKLPPLLENARERIPERLHYMGVSFGLTPQLHKFWCTKGAYKPVYIRQTPNDITGEHSSIFLRELNCEGMVDAPTNGWLDSFVSDFGRRFVSLLGYQFRAYPVNLSLSLLNSGKETSEGKKNQLTANDLELFFSSADLARLGSYSRNMADYHMIVDLLPSIAKLIFWGKLPSMKLSHVQKAIYVHLGLQHQTIDQLQEQLNVPANQLLALFLKSVRKVLKELNNVREKAAEKELAPKLAEAERLTEAASKRMDSNTRSLREELDEAGKEQQKILEEKQRKMLGDIDMMEYAIQGDDNEWDKVLKNKKGKNPGIVSLKSNKQEEEGETEQSEEPKKDSKKRKMKTKTPATKKKKRMRVL